MTNKTEAAKTGNEKKANPQTPAMIDRTLADSVLNKVKIFTANKDLRLPPDYSPENALKAAWLLLLETKDSNKKPVLEVCTKDSIANALLKMVLLGLNPLKSQCDFIAYGEKLSCDVSYFGTIALARRNGQVDHVLPVVVYAGDEFQYEINNGVKKVTKHIQAFENIDINKIKGAYATVFFEDPDKEPYVEIMTIVQIRQAWQQGAAKGNSPAHQKFPDQMCGKTVIGRACKLFINASDDSDLGIESQDQRTIESKQAIANNANKEEITMDVNAEDVTDKNNNGEENKTEGKDNNSQPEVKEETVTAEASTEPSKLPGF